MNWRVCTLAAAVVCCLFATACRTEPTDPANAPCLDKGGDIYWVHSHGRLICEPPKDAS